MCSGGTGDPRAGVLQGPSILGKEPEKHHLAGGKGWVLEDGSVCEIRATVEVGWEKTLCPGGGMEWKMEMVRRGCVRDDQQAKQFEPCPVTLGNKKSHSRKAPE